MDYCDKLLYYSAMRKTFAQLDSEQEHLPGLLNLHISDLPYQFHLLHAATKETHTAGDPKDLPEHQHDMYHMVLFEEGHNQFRIDGKTLPAEPGVMAITSPGQRHLFTPLKKGSITYSELSFCWTAGEKKLDVDFNQILQSLFGHTQREPVKPLQLSVGEFDLMQRCYRRFFDMLETSGDMAWPRMYLAVLQLLTEAAAILQNRIPRPRKRDAAAGEIRNYIVRNYARVLTVEDLAGHFDCSSRHLQRQFHSRFGQSPIGFLREHRVNVAKHLLRTTTLSCQQIAERTGFSDPYYFSRTFKKITTRPPLQWRKAQRTKDTS